MARRGDALHRLVDRLERAYGMDPNVSVKSPDYLIDRVSGKRREHDVVVRYTQGRRTLIVAIECRERARRIDSPQIEAFYTKCDHTGVNQGVIVSSRGFTPEALKEATALNIQCFTLGQIERPNWSLADTMEMVEREVTRTHIEIGVNSDIDKTSCRLFCDDPSGPAEIVLSGTSPFASNVLQEVATKMPEHLWDDLDYVDIEVQNVERFFLLDQNDVRHSIIYMTLSIHFTTKKSTMPVNYFSMREGNETSPIYDGGLFDLQASNGVKGSFVFLNDDDGFSIRFIAN
jgi:hypothetical protein